MIVSMMFPLCMRYSLIDYNQTFVITDPGIWYLCCELSLISNVVVLVFDQAT